MINSKGLLRRVNEQFTVEGRDLIFEFFITFSRFECALKQSITYANNHNNKLEPNWDRFASDIREKFNPDSSKALKRAVDYLNANPPKKQYLDTGDNTIKWQPRIFIENQPLTYKLCLIIRDIRNNLFHGGKFQGTFTKEISRNYQLLKNALAILNNWLTLDTQIAHLFSEPIPQ